ncbi:MAG: ATP-binding protein [Candidatus Omnitrophica bacterium]|nr:ATP-binding protein [Candidatus Omnitrophota bacterium]
MVDIQRILEMRLPKGQSAFLWGPRKVGKTTYLKQRFPDSLVYDFLKTELFIELSKAPFRLREWILAKEPRLLERPIILDEVQKAPQVLDEVHWMIENKGLQFILCGSSARKLKRGQANLLGGRAWRYEMFPLVSREIGEGDLLRILNRGLIPGHYLQEENYESSLKAYVQDYLKEEVFAEGLTRNVPAFSRFFDAVGCAHGELINYSNVARDCGVDAKTVREYYQILVDTLLGTRVEPYKKRQNRQVIGKAAKFYLFDVGVAGIFTRRSLAEERGESFGKAFEHFLLMEILAHRSYARIDYPVHFWRTKTGLEVDFILGDAEAALEVKGVSRVEARDLKALKVFADEQRPRKTIVVCNEREERTLDGGLEILPWRTFLNRLWDGKILS